MKKNDINNRENLHKKQDNNCERYNSTINKYKSDKFSNNKCHNNKMNYK